MFFLAFSSEYFYYCLSCLPFHAHFSAKDRDRSFLISLFPSNPLAVGTAVRCKVRGGRKATPRFNLLKIIIPKFALFLYDRHSQITQIEPSIFSRIFSYLSIYHRTVALIWRCQIGVGYHSAFRKGGHKLLTRFVLRGRLIDIFHTEKICVFFVYCGAIFDKCEEVEPSVWLNL